MQSIITKFQIMPVGNPTVEIFRSLSEHNIYVSGDCAIFGTCGKFHLSSCPFSVFFCICAFHLFMGVTQQPQVGFSWFLVQNILECHDWSHGIIEFPICFENPLSQKNQKNQKKSGPFFHLFALWSTIWSNLLKTLDLIMNFKIYHGQQAINCSKILHGCWVASEKPKSRKKQKKVCCFWFFTSGEALPSFKFKFFALEGCLNSTWHHPDQIYSASTFPYSSRGAKDEKCTWFFLFFCFLADASRDSL